MIQGIGHELAAFLQAALAGNILYWIYCAIRVWRRILKHTLFWVSVEDVFYWIWTGIYLFLCIYRTSNGDIRWYFILGVCGGGLFTHNITNKISKKYIDKFKKRE